MSGSPLHLPAYGPAAGRLMGVGPFRSGAIRVAFAGQGPEALDSYAPPTTWPVAGRLIRPPRSVWLIAGVLTSKFLDPLSGPEHDATLATLAAAADAIAAAVPGVDVRVIDLDPDVSTSTDGPHFRANPAWPTAVNAEGQVVSYSPAWPAIFPGWPGDFLPAELLVVHVGRPAIDLDFGSAGRARYPLTAGYGFYHADYPTITTNFPRYETWTTTYRPFGTLADYEAIVSDPAFFGGYEGAASFVGPARATVAFAAAGARKFRRHATLLYAPRQAPTPEVVIVELGGGADLFDADGTGGGAVFWPWLRRTGADCCKMLAAELAGAGYRYMGDSTALSASALAAEARAFFAG